jgi:uncharacterized damage-inducible protein DinB
MRPETRKGQLFEDLENELALTRKVLERLPEKQFDFQPHEKSMSLGRLAAHTANLANWITMSIEMDELDLAKFPPPDRNGPESSAALLAAFDQSSTKARAAFAKFDDASLDQIWTLRMGERVLKQFPRRIVLRTMCLSHMIHHRAQLLTYLRILDEKVPSVYGPSADEPGM